MIWKNEVLQDILKWAEKNADPPFDFNSIDNLFFLHTDNHLGSHAEYDRYISNKITSLESLSGEKAYYSLLSYIEGIQDAFKKEFIGKQRKIDDLKF